MQERDLERAPGSKRRGGRRMVRARIGCTAAAGCASVVDVTLALHGGRAAAAAYYYEGLDDAPSLGRYFRGQSLVLLGD